MGFPDRIERTMELAHPPAKVWAALTTAEGLAAWFGEEAAIDLRPGGAAWMRWANGYSVEMRVERVEEPMVFGFTWQIEELPEEDPRRTYVEFTLEPAGAGTRLTVVETGFAQLPEDAYRKVYDGHTEGWGRELGEMAGTYTTVANMGGRPGVMGVLGQLLVLLARRGRGLPLPDVGLHRREQGFHLFGVRPSLPQPGVAQVNVFCHGFLSESITPCLADLRKCL